jgi:ABC-type nitrate/sulfonate/bicarbonate transport system permease component
MTMPRKPPIQAIGKANGSWKSNGVLQQLIKPLPFILALVEILVAWELVILVFHPHASILPGPVVVANEFWRLASNGDLFVHAGVSILRVSAAWTISGCLAVPLGIVMGWSTRLEKLVNPIIELFRPISPMAWIPLAILWFGINEQGKVFVVCIATFFPTLLSTIAGVKRIDRVLIQAGQVLGCKTFWSLFHCVIIPAALPSIMVGLRISFGAGWAAIIAAELVAARSGLGYLIANGMDILRADEVIVGMATIGFLGALFDALIRAASRRFVWGS